MEQIKRPLIVVKRRFYDQFVDGTKTIEYRRHRPPYTIRVFYPGRAVRIGFNYNLARFPVLNATVVSFTVEPARAHPAMLDLYPQLQPDDEIALIKLAIGT
jgi:hypothetical protein